MNNHQMDKNYMQGFLADAQGIFRFCCALMLAMAAGAGMAQTSAPVAVQAVPAPPAAQAPTSMSRERFDELEARAPLNQRYPAGSIKSDQTAQKALDEAQEDRRAAELRYIIDQRACYQKFMVSSCLEQAKERKRASDKSIKQVENEAKVYQRQATVDERDRSLAEQQQKDQEDAARRLQEQQQKQADAARKVAESNAKNREVQQRVEQNKNVPDDYRVQEHQAKIRQQQAEEAARAPERAANAAAREQRIKDAEAHRLEVERKKAEKERERAEHKKREAQEQSGAAPAAP